MILLLLICCWLLLPLQDSVIVLYFATLSPFLFCDHLDGEERESWLLCLVCLPGVSWLLCGYFSQCHEFVCSLWYSVTIFGCHSCEQRWLWGVCTFAWSSLSLRHSSKFSCGDSKLRLNAILREQRRIWPVCTIAQAYLYLGHCTKSLVLPKMAICVLFTPAVNTLVSLPICAGKGTGQCNKYQDLLCWQQRLLGVCTFAQARLSLLHSIEISCAGWNGDFCNVYVNSEWCGESAPSTTGLLCNHQCVVSMLKNAPSAL